jgi:hypothetical protein
MTIDEKLEKENILFHAFQDCDITFYQLLEELNKLYVDEPPKEMKYVKKPRRNILYRS